MSHTECHVDELEERHKLIEYIEAPYAFLESGRATLLTTAHLAQSENPLNHDASQRSPQDMLAAIESNQQARFVLRVESDNGPRALKFYCPTSAAKRLYYAFRASPSQGAHTFCDTLNTSALWVPQSYGYCTLRDDRSLVRSMQIMEYVPHAPSLGDVLQQGLAAAQADPQKRHAVMTWLADHLVALHRKGIYHSLFTPFHIFVLGDALQDNGNERLMAISLDRCSRHRLLDHDQRLNNLAQCFHLALPTCSESERFRFVQHYCESIPEEGLDVENSYRKIQALSPGEVAAS